MTALRGMQVWFRQLPLLMRVGLWLFMFGGVLDLIYHTAPPGLAGSLDMYLGADGVFAHLVTLGGMVVTLLGMFLRVLREPQIVQDQVEQKGGIRYS